MRRRFAHAPLIAPLTLTLTLAIAGCGAPEPDARRIDGESSVPSGGTASSFALCGLERMRCVAAHVPLLDQFDPVLLEYDWHVFAREPFASAAEKGRAVASHAGYDTAVAMVQAAALEGRSPHEAIEGSRTREVLAAPLVQAVWAAPGRKAFRRAQVRQLFAPKSQYDGGGRERAFATRGNAYHLPELLADLGPLTRLEPEGCDPRRFRSCARVEGAAGEYTRDDHRDARSISTETIAAHFDASFLQVIAFERTASEAHAVTIAGVDRGNAAFPLVAYDPARAKIRAARVDLGDGTRGTALRFADETSARYPITLVERLRVRAPAQP